MTYTEKDITNENNKQVCCTSIISLIFMSDIFCIYLMRDVLLLLSTILYDL